MNKNENVALSELRKRKPIYDVIRVISCLCIIAIHCTDALIEEKTYDYVWYIGNVIQSIVRIALPMFVLLSGALLLNSKKEEPLGGFYMKRLLKICLPLYIYSLIYLFIFKYNYNLEFFMPLNFLKAVKTITEGNVFFHLWFAYMIIGIYLCTPFLKKMCQSLTDKECINLTILIFSISIIMCLLPTFKINVGITCIPFISWTLVFLLGYLVTREAINKHYKLIYILGIISWIIAVIVPRTNMQVNNLYDFSIMMFFEVMALFIFFVRSKDKICKKDWFNKAMEFFSKYSWEIFLVHGGMLVKLDTYIPKNSMNLLLWTFIMIILVFVLSFIFAFIMHNIVVKNLEKLISKIIELCKNKFKHFANKESL